MILNRDAGAVRSSSHTGLRTMRRPTQPTVGGEGVVNMPRVNPAVAAVTPWRVNSNEATRSASRALTVGELRVATQSVGATRTRVGGAW